MLIDRGGIQFYLVLAGEKPFSTTALTMDSPLCQLLLVVLALLETVRQIGRSVATHIDLNLVETLAHAARLPSSHLIQWELLGSTRCRLLLKVMI